jgi:hypothetical protein
MACRFLLQTALCKGRRSALLIEYMYPLALVLARTRTDNFEAIVHGLSTPLVLGQEGDHFKLSGPCFVEGIMHGEAVSWAEEEADTFHLL